MNLATSHPGAPVSRMPNEGKPASSPLIPLRMIRVKHIIVALLLSVFFFLYSASSPCMPISPGYSRILP